MPAHLQLIPSNDLENGTSQNYLDPSVRVITIKSTKLIQSQGEEICICDSTCKTFSTRTRLASVQSFICYLFTLHHHNVVLTTWLWMLCMKCDRSWMLTLLKWYWIHWDIHIYLRWFALSIYMASNLGLRCNNVLQVNRYHGRITNCIPNVSYHSSFQQKIYGGLALCVF